MKLALMGAGSRGMIYAEYACHQKGQEIVAVVDPNPEKRRRAAESLRIPADRQFAQAEPFFALGKIADALIIASLDRDHYGEAMAALDAGYDILLEKPISPDPAECLNIQRKAEALGRRVTVCHVLRYTSFYAKIKEILEEGKLGRVLSIDHSENIGNYHMAHSFVRGNWRNSGLSSPIIMQKSCHDCDLMVWYVGSRARRVSSFGSLNYFRKENAPEGSAERCLECPAAEGCRYDARKAYLPGLGMWPADVVSPTRSPEELLEVLKTSPYGRCVYRCDNNVCDHQVTIVEFENDATVTFHLSAFTNRNERRIHIMCENGEIYGNDGTKLLEVSRFASCGLDEYTMETIRPAAPSSGHGGGDSGIVDDFLRLMEAKESGTEESLSSIARSVESHLIAYAAELSRVTGKTVEMDELRQKLEQNGSI